MTKKSGAARRRHGRVRRWLVRPFFWGLAILALVFLATLAYLDSESFESRASAWGLKWLEARLGRQVSVGEIRLEIFPLAIDIQDVEIAGVTPDAAPFATARRVVVGATVGTVLRPGMTLDHVFIEAPEITVGFDDAGEHDAPRWNRRRRDRSEPARFRVDVGQLQVVRGSLSVAHERYPLDLAAQDIRADLVGGSDVELRGRATASDVEVQLRGHGHISATWILMLSFSRDGSTSRALDSAVLTSQRR